MERRGGRGGHILCDLAGPTLPRVATGVDRISYKDVVLLSDGVGALLVGGGALFFRRSGWHAVGPTV